MCSISHLKLFKELPTLGAENRLQENIEMETAVSDTGRTVTSEEVGEMGGDVSHKPHDSKVIKVEVTGAEDKECLVAKVASRDPSHVDVMFMEDGKDKEWFLKSYCLSHICF
ncbi:hypothetical protein KIL84_007950 [Mauremys mutica]|uniref:Uncharacterized protein n=1 Tax=Mauremys mutica TaxID=74926 RepID=A0A9D4AQG7_9SAUR|nr:hypothetical protein KIL84_007950 [Mauremys mutica]